MEATGPTSTNVLRVSPLTPNVTTEHLLEIFGNFGKIQNLQIQDYPTETGIMRSAVISFESAESTEAAISHLDKGEIDGAIVDASLDQAVPHSGPNPEHMEYQDKTEQIP